MNTSFLRCLLAMAALGLTVTIAAASEGTISVLNGKATVAGQPAAVKTKVGDGDDVRTGAGSSMEIKFSDGSIARLGPNAVFRFAAKSSNFTVERGEGLFSFAKGKGGFTVSTPSLNARILGTTVDVKVSRNLVEYSCLEGKCRIGPHTLTAGDQLTLRGSNVAYSAPKTKVDLNRFAKENPLLASMGKLPNFP